MSEKNESYENNLQHEFKKSLIDTINTLNEISKNIDDNLSNENSIKSTGDEIKVVENKLKRLLNKVDKSEYSKNFTFEEE